MSWISKKQVKKLHGHGRARRVPLSVSLSPLARGRGDGKSPCAKTLPRTWMRPSLNQCSWKGPHCVNVPPFNGGSPALPTAQRIFLPRASVTSRAPLERKSNLIWPASSPGLKRRWLRSGLPLHPGHRLKSCLLFGKKGLPDGTPSIIVRRNGLCSI